MSEKVWRNVPPEVIIRDIIESSGLCVPVDYPSERISVGPGDVIRPLDLIRGEDSMSEEPSAYNWVEYGLSAKETMQNAAENFQRAPSAREFMAMSEPVSEEPSEKKPMTPEQRLEMLEQLRWDLLIVGEQIRNPLQALEMLRAMGGKVKVLMEDARAEMEKAGE